MIAEVAGHAVAGGFELPLWCDLRVFNRCWGIPLIDGGTVRLPALVGLWRALDIVLHWPPTGRSRRPLALQSR